GAIHFAIGTTTANQYRTFKFDPDVPDTPVTPYTAEPAPNVGAPVTASSNNLVYFLRDNAGIPRVGLMVNAGTTLPAFGGYQLTNAFGKVAPNSVTAFAGADDRTVIGAFGIGDDLPDGAVTPVRRVQLGWLVRSGESILSADA